MRLLKTLLGFTGFAVVALGMSGQAQAASCGNTAGGFEAWKTQFASEASGRVGQRALTALQGTSYATKTIAADRGQHSFKLSLSEFMEKRGSKTIVSRGKKQLAGNQALFDRIEQRYGVPAGPLIAIWGMETGFGSFLGNQNTISAVATLAYDCRRTEFFTDQLYSALQLVDKGILTSAAQGAAHGEIGQTQFLPKNVLQYGADGDGDGRIDMVGSKADALASTANFLKGHGWRAGAGYQQGEPNYAAIQGWNAASVYQQAIALMGAEIDGR